MRTRPIVAAAALIAAVALVASAGPASTRAPGTPRTIDTGAFSPVVVDRVLGSATTNPTPAQPWTSAGLLAGSSILRDPGEAPRRPVVDQQRPSLGVEVKPAVAWRRAAYSWYGPGFYGSGTACGQTYSKTILGVAHRSLPCGTMVTLRNPRNGRTITVPVIDRGPYVAGRMWDLSRATCTYLGDCYTSVIQYRVP